RSKHQQIERLTQPPSDYDVRARARIQLEDLDAEIVKSEAELAAAQAAEQADQQALDRGEFELSSVQRRRAAFVPLEGERADVFVARFGEVVAHLEGLISMTPIGGYYATIQQDDAIIARLTGEAPAELPVARPLPEAELV